MKIGIVFAGQGAQYSGMGKDLYETYPEAKAVFDMAGDQVKEWCFNGDAETLKQTHVTQPTIIQQRWQLMKRCWKLKKKADRQAGDHRAGRFQPRRIFGSDCSRRYRRNQQRYRHSFQERRDDAGSRS
ncbi:MAG: hypothetical protein V8R14_01530 [Clostridia bacterium]